jgi:uncharacterized protein
MRAADVDILLVPGWTGAGPDHWMTRWQPRLKTSQRVEQDDWDVVTKAAWTARLLERVALTTRPVLLVAHSCGVPTVVHAAPQFAATRANVIGAMLVATASEAACADLPTMDPAFAVYPRDPLPFPSLLVASRNDFFCSYDDAGDLALAWGSELVDAGESGHLNIESGHGPWPEGVMRMASFLQRLPGPQ